MNVVLDPKQNALILTPTAVFRAWLRQQPRDGPMFGAPATVHQRSAGGTRRANLFQRDSEQSGE